MMAQSKLEHYSSEGSNTPTSNPHRKPIKHILMGSADVVTSTIHHLQVIGYASVGDWSPLLPTANPDEVMSILIRQILMQ